MAPAGTGVGKGGTPLVGRGRAEACFSQADSVADQRCCAAWWAWSGVACRSGVSCGGVCTVTRVPGGSPARHPHGNPSMGRGFYGLHNYSTQYTWLIHKVSVSACPGQPPSEVTQLSGWVLNGQQVRDELADQGVPADLLGRDALGLEQRGDCLVDLSALGMSAGHVDQHSGLPFSRQSAGIYYGGGPQRPARIAELDGDRDLIQPDVGRAELGVVLVVPLAEPPGDLTGPLELAIGEIRVIEVGCDHGALQRQ